MASPNTTPIFTATPKVGMVAISTANTNRNGSGTIGTVFTAGTNGSRINQITVIAQGTTTAGMVRLYIYDGSTAFLYKEIPVTAVTPSGTVQAFVSVTSFPNGLVIPTGYSLRASTNNAETFNIVAEGGDF